MVDQIGFSSSSRTMSSTSNRTTNERNVVMKKVALYAATIGASALLVSSAVAQANPVTPMSTIDSSAAQMCGVIDHNPTKDGVLDGMASLNNRGLDQMDVALVLITAIHHVCPQREALMMSVIDPMATDAICKKA